MKSEIHVAYLKTQRVSYGTESKQNCRISTERRKINEDNM